MKHTNIPWKFTISPKHNRPQISGENGHQICLMWRDGEMEANAKYIVKCCNNYENLITLLKASEFLLSQHKEGYAENNLIKDIKQALKSCQEE